MDAPTMEAPPIVERQSTIVEPELRLTAEQRARAAWPSWRHLRGGSVTDPGDGRG